MSTLTNNISFCNFIESSTVSEIREEFSDTATVENLISEFRNKEFQNKKGAFDAIVAILLNGIGTANQYQKNFCNCTYDKKTGLATTWSQNALKWTTGNINDNKALQNFAQTSIKETDTLLDVFNKLDKWTEWISEEKKGTTLQILNKNYSAKEKSNQQGGTIMPLHQELINLITNGKCSQIIFTGAPGTGKSREAIEIANELGAELSNRKYQFVQFHPSYDYTDFVEGLRPIQQNEQISFAKVDGIFKKFCRNVVAKNEVPEFDNYNPPIYFFIIDEINRANLSKVFGELMFGLEKDKRGKKNKFDTQYQNLPTYNFDNMAYIPEEDDCFRDGFYIPENVIIIGTMNDIDRSVESMDFALRRRFEWKEFIVDQSLLTTAFNSGSFGNVIKENSSILSEHIISLNTYIRNNGKEYGLNRQYDISQGQAANVPITCTSFDDLLNYMWQYRIESLLREYLRGEDNIESFLSNCKNTFLSSVTPLKDTIQS